MKGMRNQFESSDNNAVHLIVNDLDNVFYVRFDFTTGNVVRELLMDGITHA